MGREKLARSTKTMMRARCSSKGMWCETARHIGRGAKALLHHVRIMSERQRGARCEARTPWLEHVCHGKEYGLYLLGQQRILKCLRRKLDRSFCFIGCGGKAEGERSEIWFLDTLTFSSLVGVIKISGGEAFVSRSSTVLSHVSREAFPGHMVAQAFLKGLRWHPGAVGDHCQGLCT